MIHDPLFLTSLLKTFLFLPIFLIAIFISFYIPAKVIIGKNLDEIKSDFAKIILILVLGIVLWGYQGFIFGFLQMRFLTYAYLGIFSYLFFKQSPINLRTLYRSFAKQIRIIPYPLLIIFAIGIFGQIQAFFIAGLELSNGIFIFDSSGEDAFWHTSLITQIIKRFPPFEPGLVNVHVYNYHYWSSLVPAELIRIFHLPILQTQFHYMYIFISFLLGGTAYALGKTLKFSYIAIVVLVFLQYFSSDILYILTFIVSHSFIFSVGPLEEGTAFLANPPRAYSIVVALGGLSFFSLWIKNKNFKLGLITALLFGSIIGFKVHTAIAILFGLGCVSLYFLIRRQWKMIVISILTVLFSFGVYFPVNHETKSLIMAPFEISRNFAVQPDLHISRLELARGIYFDHNNYLQVFRMDLTMLGLFFLIEFGIRNIGWLGVEPLIKKTNFPFIIFLYAGALFSITFASIFIQPIAQADIFNSFLAASLFLSIPTAFVIGNILSKNKLWYIRLLIIIIILGVTIPRWIYKTTSFNSYFNTKAPSTISNGEIEAMKYIQNNTSLNDVVLVLNQGSWDSVFPYVSIFTQRDMYLSGQVILGRHGILYPEREKIVKKIITTSNPSELKEILIKNHINLLYFYGLPGLQIKPEDVPLKKIFSNSLVTVYRLEQ